MIFSRSPAAGKEEIEGGNPSLHRHRHEHADRNGHQRRREELQQLVSIPAMGAGGERHRENPNHRHVGGINEKRELR